MPPRGGERRRPTSPHPTGAFVAAREHASCSRRPLLAALLHVRPDELLRVLLEHVVDLVEHRVDVLGQLLLPRLGIGRGAIRLRRVLDLVLAPGGPPLASMLLLRHVNPLRIRIAAVPPRPQAKFPCDPDNFPCRRPLTPIRRSGRTRALPTSGEP